MNIKEILKQFPIKVLHRWAIIGVSLIHLMILLIIFQDNTILLSMVLLTFISGCILLLHTIYIIYHIVKSPIQIG